MLTTIILLIIAIFLSAFFSGAEVALVSITEIKARHLLEQKIKGAKALLYLKEHPKRMLITILIGNNIVNIGGSALATKLAIDLFQDAGIGIAIGAMTFLILTFGEIAPKTFAAKRAKKVALAVAPIIVLLKNALSPFVWLFLQISRLFEGRSYMNEPLVTEQEVRHIVTVGEEEGQIKPGEKEMIHRVFRFDDTTAEDVMTPRTDMFALDWNMTINEALPLITENEYSRIPVYEDQIDDIQGVVFARDVLRHLTKGSKDDLLKSLAQPALFVPEHKKIDKLLKKLQEKKIHMAIVVDEHGGVSGLITIEDILEELVGEIFDESDDIEHLIRPKGENKWLVLGKTQIEYINDELDLNIPDDDDYNTIAGFIQHHSGRVPAQGERIKVKKHKIEILISKVEGPVILQVIIRKI